MKKLLFSILILIGGTNSLFCHVPSIPALGDIAIELMGLFSSHVTKDSELIRLLQLAGALTPVQTAILVNNSLSGPNSYTTQSRISLSIKIVFLIFMTLNSTVQGKQWLKNRGIGKISDLLNENTILKLMLVKNVSILLVEGYLRRTFMPLYF